MIQHLLEFIQHLPLSSSIDYFYPKMNSEQLTLPLFNSTFADLFIEYSIQGLTITVNKRLRRAWQVRISRHTGERELIIPSYMEEAPIQVKKALIEWAQLPISRGTDRKKSVKKRKAELEKIVWAFVADSKCAPPRRIDPDSLRFATNGAVYDLRGIFDSINSHFFNGTVDAVLKWGSPGSLSSYQTSRLCSNGQKVHMIVIAGTYDHPKVPRFAIEAVMYHEMLHIVIPPRQGNGRKVIHGADFRKAERAYPEFDKWMHWEREHMRRYGRQLRRKRN
jgi:hypothetical protein